MVSGCTFGRAHRNRTTRFWRIRGPEIYQEDQQACADRRRGGETHQTAIDLVGNNIPVFFIQDAITFPDLIHSVKMEPDRGYPQAASAHDTFWDFISLIPESVHMILWAMSDRTLPRSLRMMEGFGGLPSRSRRARHRLHERSLLQGRLFSYTDTQLLRLGGANFHEIPINRPKCPMGNFQRDGVRRMDVNPGQVAYEPNSLAPDSPREDPRRGFASHTALDHGDKLRARSETFADHYSQPRLFFRSMSEPEQRHIVSAFTFELSKVSTAAIRRRMLGHLSIIDAGLLQRVAEGLGMEGQAEQITPARPPIDMKPSPALSLVKKARPTLEGRKVGVLVTDGTDGAFVDALKSAVEKAGAQLQVVAPKIGGVTLANGKSLPADHQLAGGPSILFDAVVVAASAQGAQKLQKEAAAIDWIRDAFGHLKVIGSVETASPLLAAAGIEADAGVVMIGKAKVQAFIDAAKGGRIWDREPKLRGHL